MTYAEEQAFKAEVDSWRGMFESSDQRNYERIDRHVMSEIGELKKALCEFDNFRFVWAEVAANNTAPGRNSEFCKRLEIMQGKAIQNVDNAAWRLRIRLMGKE